MERVVSIGARRTGLNVRRTIQVDLPEWIIRVLEFRVAEANAGAADDPVSANDVVEWSLVAPIRMNDVPAYEAAIPGLSAALSRWLIDSTYDPPMWNPRGDPRVLRLPTRNSSAPDFFRLGVNHGCSLTFHSQPRLCRFLRSTFHFPPPTVSIFDGSTFRFQSRLFPFLTIDLPF